MYMVSHRIFSCVHMHEEGVPPVQSVCSCSVHAWTACITPYWGCSVLISIQLWRGLDKLFARRSPSVSQCSGKPVLLANAYNFCLQIPSFQKQVTKVSLLCSRRLSSGIWDNCSISLCFHISLLYTLSNMNGASYRSCDYWISTYYEKSCGRDAWY